VRRAAQCCAQSNPQVRFQLCKAVPAPPAGRSGNSVARPQGSSGRNWPITSALCVPAAGCRRQSPTVGRTGQPNAAGARDAQSVPAVLRLLHGLGSNVVGPLVQPAQASGKPVCSASQLGWQHPMCARIGRAAVSDFVSKLGVRVKGLVAGCGRTSCLRVPTSCRLTWILNTAWTGWRFWCTRNRPSGLLSSACFLLPRMPKHAPQLNPNTNARYGIPFRELGLLRMRITLRPIRTLVRRRSAALLVA
jgi:hypothetical protein